MTYQAPLADIGFTLKYGAGFGPALEERREFIKHADSYRGPGDSKERPSVNLIFHFLLRLLSGGKSAKGAAPGTTLLAPSFSERKTPGPCRLFPDEPRRRGGE